MNSGLKRSQFQRFQKSFADKGKNPTITQGTLQLEAVLSTSGTTFNFPLTDNDGPSKTRTEKRLNINDVFMVTEVAVFLAAPTDAEDVTYRLATYPNPAIFTATTAAMEAVYKGELRVTVDNKVYLPGWDLMDHYQVPRTQDGALPSPVRDSFNGSRDGYIALDPTVVFSGNRKSEIQINLPKALTGLEAGKQPRLIVKFKGYLAQGAATFNV